MTLDAWPAFQKYKPTGIEWQAAAPEHWEVKPLFTVAKVVSETNRPDLELLSVYLGQGVIRFSDVEEKRTNATSVDLSKYQVVRPGNLVLNNQQAWRGSVGVSRNTGIVSPAYIVADLGNAFDPKFADYYFRTSTTVAHFLVSSKGVGTIQRNLYWPALRRCPITIPPLPEQRAITAFLDGKCAKVDEAVRIKEEQIALLRERRQILIQQAVTRGLNPSVPMKDSGIDWIGQIPTHWEMRRLRHLTTKIGSGSTPTGGALTYADDGIPLLRSQNVLFGSIEFESAVRITPKVHSNMRNSQVQLGDVLLNITGGSIGRCHYVTIDGPLNVNQHVCIVRPSSDITTVFLNMLLSSQLGQKQIWLYQQGGGREGLNFAAIKEFTFPVPPLGEQRQIEEATGEQSVRFDAAIRIKEDQIAALKEYKTSLINAAVTGKINVSQQESEDERQKTS